MKTASEIFSSIPQEKQTVEYINSIYYDMRLIMDLLLLCPKSAEETAKIITDMSQIDEVMKEYEKKLNFSRSRENLKGNICVRFDETI